MRMLLLFLPLWQNFLDIAKKNIGRKSCCGFLVFCRDISVVGTFFSKALRSDSVFFKKRIVQFFSFFAGSP